LELNPAEKTSYINLGTFAVKLGQYEEAETAFLKAIEFDPGDPEAHLRLSWIYGKTNNFAKAKDYAQKALHCNPTEQQKSLAKCYIDSSNKALQQK
jgi:tetratricopeptide (TPR) repeat protein